MHTFSAVNIVYLDVFSRQNEQASIKIEHTFNMFAYFLTVKHMTFLRIFIYKKLPQSFFVNLRFLFTFDNQIQLSKQRGTYFESAENTGLYLTILEPDTLTTVRLSSPMLFSYGGCHYLTCALYHKILNSKLNLYIWSGMIFINISLRMLHT